MKRSIRVGVIIAVLILTALVPNAGDAQVLSLKDTVFTSIPYGENFQCIDVEPSLFSDSMYLYTGFNLSTHGLIKVYRTTSVPFASPLKEIRTITLPFDFVQPNDIKLFGDTLIVTATGNPELGRIGGFNKFTGVQYFSYLDTMTAGWRVWASFILRDTLYRLISNVQTTFVQKFSEGSFSNVYTLLPSPMRDQNNLIQGCTLIDGHIFAILTSSPNRIDFYDLDNDAKFIGRYFAEEGGLQTQGISEIDTKDRTYLLYGLRFPNKINTASFTKTLIPPRLEHPRNDSVVNATSVSFTWSPIEGATRYWIRVATDSGFSSVIFQDSAYVGQVFVKNFNGHGRYYWSVKGRNFRADGPWSSTRSFVIPIKKTVLFDTLNIFWGEFHAHTELSFDATGSVKTFYEHARDVAGLDIAIATDHDIFSSSGQWESAKSVANTHYTPGKFVTLVAYEWTNDGFEKGGHRTVYFPGNDAPRFIAKDPVTAFRMPFEELVTSVRDAGGIMVLAHPDYTPANIKSVDPSIQVGVEFYGYEGFTFEHFRNPGAAPKQYEGFSAVNAYLNGGVMGAYAVSDAHNGIAGSRGLTAVIADTLTRESVFEAMKRRRVYATTGPRAKLFFSSDSFFMGDEGMVSNGPKSFRVIVDSPDSIASVTLLRNSQNLFTSSGINARSIDLSFIDFNPQFAPLFYYVRVIFKNGHRLWSTPIFFRKYPTPVDQPRRASQSSVSLEIYPNPSRGAVRVNYHLNDNTSARFTVYDILGRTMIQKSVNDDVSQPQPGTFEVRDLANGVYFLEMNTKVDRTVKKFMIMK